MPFTMAPDSVQAFIQDQLAVAEAITESTMAFARFVKPPVEEIQPSTWSRRALAEYGPAELEEHCPLDQAGVWADAARTGEPRAVNDFTKGGGHSGLPGGNAVLTRMLVVPVLDETVEILLGVGNKAAAYDQEDLESLQLFANQLWRVVRRSRLEAELEHRAYYDPLTGIPNRVLGSEALRLTMQQCARRGTLVAAAFIDLDHFKDINDNYEHVVGDEVLRITARRMRIALREGDTLARLGGDEFLAVLPDLPDEEAASVALDRLLAMVAEPVRHAEAVIHPSASVGISVYTAAMGPLDPEQLIRQADRAMYDAKTAGRKTWRFFDHEVNTAIERHHQLAREVEQGIAAGEFRVYYQPKVSLDTGAVTSVEALVRWEHPEEGLLSPGQFIPQLRNHRVLSGLGDWMMLRSLQELQSLAPSLRPPSVSINIAPRHLLEADFMDRVRRAVALLDPEAELRLELEILETSALQNLDEVEAIIEECAGLGIDFALDDFGSGYSSLVYLHALPIRVLKIDQTFVIGMLEDASDIAILRSIIALGKALRLNVVAEGAETREHLQLLRALGCAEAQGYAISAPVPLEALHSLLTQWQPSTLLEKAEGSAGAL
jgi:diguanylate cyclase (GGDEF)-like protein